jgi:hypothetical protein
MYSRLKNCRNGLLFDGLTRRRKLRLAGNRLLRFDYLVGQSRLFGRRLYVRSIADAVSIGVGAIVADIATAARCAAVGAVIACVPIDVPTASGVRRC